MNECSILNISDSPLFQKQASPINVERYQYSSDEYHNILEDAINSGMAVIIEGTEPTEEELIKIKNVLDKMGNVKIFRKRKTTIKKDISIKPSIFHTISISKIDKEEAEKIKYETISYIDKLINN
jgi:hypothetical protein